MYQCVCTHQYIHTVLYLMRLKQYRTYKIRISFFYWYCNSNMWYKHSVHNSVEVLTIPWWSSWELHKVECYTWVIIQYIIHRKKINKILLLIMNMSNDALHIMTKKYCSLLLETGFSIQKNISKVAKPRKNLLNLGYIYVKSCLYMVM